MRTPLCFLLAMTLGATATAQHAQPPSDMRSAEVRRDALVGATVIVRPGESLDNATILLSDGVIEAIGTDLEVPNGYRQHDLDGLMVYPGLIEPAATIDVSAQQGQARGAPGGHWNSLITPQVSVLEAPVFSSASRSSLRSLGFTTAQVLPQSGILRGSGAVILLAEEDAEARPLRERSMLAASLKGNRGWGSGYPGSRMGSIALCRQTLAEADWQARYHAIYADDPTGLEPPEQADALDALRNAITNEQVMLFEVDDELDALRAAEIVKEFELDAVLLGSGTEFRRLNEIRDTGIPLIVPLEFPDTPKAADPWAADRITLRDLLSWKHAPENPRRLLAEGIAVALTTHRLDSPSQFPAQVRKAIEAGLPHEEMLACLTTRPARMLGIEDVAGTIEPGRLANLVVSDGELFAEKSKIRTVWVAGREHEINPPPSFPLDGGFKLQVESDKPIPETSVALDRTARSVTFTLPADPQEDEPADAEQSEPVADEDASAPAEGEDESTPAKPAKPRSLKAKSVVVEAHRIAFTSDGEPFGVDGQVRAAAVVVGDRMLGTADTESGSVIHFQFVPEDAPSEEPEQKTEDSEEEEPSEDDASNSPPAIEPLPLPLGAYGLLERPRSRTVFIDNATIWTCGPAGVIRDGDMLVVDGRIVAVDTDLEAPEDALVIDGQGRHVTPGLIDCHSHTGISGGVNEGGQNNTAECRIGDVINPDDIDFFRQLAGGTTVANQLHGSANPIGGQNSVIKLRWGGTVDDMRFETAKPGIKFALGENVKRGDNYPNTRMGVAAFIEDAFRAGREYQAAQDRFAAMPPDEQARKMPPRPDLELDAMAEILAGDRLIHCHSYRQDEILMLLRLCEKYDVTIGTLQHVLEGYKVAEAIASHGAGASSFSDWWAYKMEVMDAIPHNGALMNEVGVLVSFNSDSDELARRMNDEAAKAIRWGGMDPHDALAFVTINPARQLRIDDRVGSLEPGKDGDFAIWNNDPLSSYSVCEQTWIEGARHFDRESAAEAHAEATRDRARLLAEANGSGGSGRSEAGGGRPGRRGGPPPGVRGRRPTRLLARLLLEREATLMQRVLRGMDPEAAEPAACGCGAGSLIELARSLAAEGGNSQ